MGEVIAFVNFDTGEYFFSTDSSQVPVPEGFECFKRCLPVHTLRSLRLPSGIISSKEDFINVYLYDCREIPNPDQNSRPEYAKSYRAVV